MKGRAWLAAAVLAILVLSVSLAGGCGEEKTSDKPELSVVEPVSGPSGTKVMVIGANLGDSQEESVLDIGGKVADVSEWSDTEITAKVPGGLTQEVQGVTVLTDAGRSNEIAFMVTAPGPAPDRPANTVEHPTPVSAMLDWMKKQGMDTTGWVFSVVRQSQEDPNWKIDKADKTASTTRYFLLKKVNGNWTVIDDGGAITAAELQGDGAPSDLWVEVPAPAPAQTQQQVISEYLKSKGVDLSGATVTFVAQSKSDPTWELFQVSFPPEDQKATTYIVLHQEGGNWVVKNYASDVDQTPGMPADLQS